MPEKISSAIAAIRGSAKYPDIKGYAYFTLTEDGTAVSIAVRGLPYDMQTCDSPIFAVHIHEGRSCSDNAHDPFADAMSHWNPKNCPHPFHSGDMPPLFTAGRKASFAFLTDRFTPQDVIGKTIIIHKNYDNLHTQPSGASGEKIACGEIKSVPDYP